MYSYTGEKFPFSIENGQSVFECDHEGVQHLIDLFKVYELPLNDRPNSHKVASFNKVQFQIH